MAVHDHPVDHARSASPSALACLTKGGLAVARSLAIEYAASGVRVTALALGVIKTPMHDPASYDDVAAVHPSAAQARSTTSSTGSSTSNRPRFVTGETLQIDGGQAAGH